MVLFGATASGKTELLTDALSGRAEVVSADSMQVYRGLTIGTAKPSERVYRVLPHHLIDTHSPDQQYSVGDFVKRADKLVREIRERGNIPVVSGGTAFYLEAFLFGLPNTPAVVAEVREQISHRLAEEGLDALREELQRVDPESEARIAPNDRYRVVRALEIYASTGKKRSAFVRQWRRRPETEGCRVVGLERDRTELYRRIDNRVVHMFSEGLPDEAAGLIRAGFGGTTPGMRAIGYREFVDAGPPPWDEKRTNEILQLVQRNTRRYAKRQLTFFHRLPDVFWLPADSPDINERFLAAIS